MRTVQTNQVIMKSFLHPQSMATIILNVRITMIIALINL